MLVIMVDSYASFANKMRPKRDTGNKLDCLVLLALCIKEIPSRGGNVIDVSSYPFLYLYIYIQGIIDFQQTFLLSSFPNFVSSSR